MIRFNWNNTNDFWQGTSYCGNFTAQIKPADGKYIWTVTDNKIKSTNTNFTFDVEQAKRTVSTIASLRYSIL